MDCLIGLHNRPVCVPETLHSSRDLLILVEQPTKPVAPSDGVRLAHRRLGDWSEGSGLVEGAVRPVVVVMLFVLAQHRCGVPLVDDQHAVEEFAANGADKALGDRVGPWRLLPAVRDDDEAVSHDADENRASRALLVVMVAPSSSR